MALKELIVVVTPPYLITSLSTLATRQIRLMTFVIGFLRKFGFIVVICGIMGVNWRFCGSIRPSR